MNIKFILFLSIILFAASGCSTVTKQMNPEVKKTIRSVALQENIEKPNNIYYYGPEATPALMIAGAVGVAIAANGMQKNAVKISNIARDNNIKIQEIIRNEIADSFKRSAIKLADSAHADAQLKVSIMKYGFTIPQGFSSSLVPVLYAQADLIKNHSIIWSYSYRSQILGSKLPAYTLAEISKNPQNLNYMYTVAAKQFAEQIVTEINS